MAAIAAVFDQLSAAANADLIWLESPSNPLLAVADLDTICAAPRKPGSILSVDNTFATPLNQRPLELGADISIQLGGHSDLLGGIATARNSALASALRHTHELTGATPGTLEYFLAVRGIRTLAVRLEGTGKRRNPRHQAGNAPGRHPNQIPRSARAPYIRSRPPAAQRFRHHHFLRCSRRCPGRRRCLPPPAPHQPRHQPRSRRIHHRAPRRNPRPGIPPPLAPPPQCRHRSRRRPLASPRSSSALRSFRLNPGRSWAHCRARFNRRKTIVAPPALQPSLAVPNPVPP